MGRPVGVRLSDGTEYRGILVCLDGFMNVAMEQVEEFVEGSLKSKLGDCFIRGNNGKLPKGIHSTYTCAWATYP